MANYQVIRRLERLIYLLQQFPNSSKKEILLRMEESYDGGLTARTLERDFRALETDFGIAIHYNRAKNGYTLDSDDGERISSFLQYAGRVYLGDIFREEMKDFEELKSFVKLEDHSEFEGLLSIQPVFLAIKNQCTLQFVHENFQKETQTTYTIIPLQLREFQGRWYVVGLPEKENHIKTFGLERIRKLKVINRKKLPINSKKLKQQLDKFNHIIGLNYNASEEKELVQLAVTPKQYKYLKTLPLHSSQTLLEKLPDERRVIGLYVIPNYELIMQLLRLGDQIEVLRPKTLRKKIQSILKNTLEQYHDTPSSINS